MFINVFTSVIAEPFHDRHSILGLNHSNVLFGSLAGFCLFTEQNNPRTTSTIIQEGDQVLVFAIQ